MKRRTLALASVAVVALAVVACLFGELQNLACRQRLMRAGFPDGIAKMLAPLQRRHPNWRFVPRPVNDLKWEQIVKREETPGWNLVARTNWAPGRWQGLGSANYTPYLASEARAYDSGTWYQASKEAIAYFLDTRNFFDETHVFMFESLAFNEAVQTREATELALKGSFMAKAACDGGDERFSDLIYRVGRDLRISPVFLAARLTTEQGAGTVQGRGCIGDSLLRLSTNGLSRVGGGEIWGGAFTPSNEIVKAIVASGPAAYNGYYNLFNIGATGSGLFAIRYNAWREATSEETRRLYGGAWTSQEKAIRGGAIKIRELYLKTCRHTPYFQKFSVLEESKGFRFKQYMQNIAAPLQEARQACAAYKSANSLCQPHVFEIPVYRNMPDCVAPDPAKGNSTYSVRR